jgi:hypothetical protein
MKKIVLILLIALTSTNVYCQKKKKTVSKKASSIFLTGVGNVSAEISKVNFFLCINKKDTINIKPANFDAMPMNCKITPFTAKNTALHLITWTEVVKTSEPKKESVATITYSKIYDTATKTEVGTNTQTVTNIKEQVQLGKTAASETQERTRTEGYELVLLPTGDIVLKSKKGETKYSYDAVSMKFK